MCLFRCGHDRFRILDNAEHMATGVFLPIATDRVLIGTHDDHLTANIEALNDVSAKCSSEYFVASNLCSEYEARIPLIGSWSNLLSENELEQLLAELTQGPVTKPGLPGNTFIQGWPRAVIPDLQPRRIHPFLRGVFPFVLTHGFSLLRWTNICGEPANLTEGSSYAPTERDPGGGHACA